MPKPQTDEAIRSDLCARIIYRHHPLIDLYRQRTGLSDVGIRDLKRFVVDLPSEEFNACLFGAGVAP